MPAEGAAAPKSLVQALQRVAADVSRRILVGRKMAPTDVGGYLKLKCPA